MAYSPEQRRKIYQKASEMRASGVSIVKTAKAVGITTTTLKKILEGNRPQVIQFETPRTTPTLVLLNAMQAQLKLLNDTFSDFKHITK